MNFSESGIKVSVIIPNLNSTLVGQTVKSIIKQESNIKFEIFVVGLDQPKLLLKYQDSINHIDPGEKIPPGVARNLGVLHSKGEYLIFIDSDAIANDNFINGHLNAHKKKSNVIVGGSINFPKTPYLQLCDNIATFHEYMNHIPAGEKRIIPTVNMSVSRENFESLIGFNHNPAGEDSDFSKRAIQNNFLIHFEPGIGVLHLPNRKTIKDLLQHSFKLGRYTTIFSEFFNDGSLGKAVLRSKLIRLMFSPIITLLTVLKIYVLEKLPLEYWHTLPVVVLIKFSWCIGASLSSFDSHKFLSDI